MLNGFSNILSCLVCLAFFDVQINVLYIWFKSFGNHRPAERVGWLECKNGHMSCAMCVGLVLTCVEGILQDEDFD